VPYPASKCAFASGCGCFASNYKEANLALLVANLLLIRLRFATQEVVIQLR